jgi:hypothetical protein
MTMRAWWRNLSQKGVAAGLMGVVLLGFGGCASEPPKPSAPSVTPDHVRGHAEKAFGNLKQEERNRGGETGGTSY